MLTSGIIKQCIKEAESSNYKLKVGCVIFKGKRIISSGHNGNRSCRIHPKYQDYPNSLHAEQDALIGMDWNSLRKCNILVLRLCPSGKLAESRPCSKCFSLLKYVGIKNIYYSTRSGTIEYCNINDFEIKKYRNMF